MDPSRIRIRGPLTTHVGGLWETLAAQGYTALSAVNVVRVMAHLSRWLERERLSPNELTVEPINRFLRHRRRAGYTGWRSERGLVPILAYLREQGAVPPVEPAAPGSTPPVEALVDRYVEYLRTERALLETTVDLYHRVAVAFLTGHDDVQGLTAADVTAFVLEASHTGSIGYTKLKVTALRSLLRYLHVRGEIAVELAAAVPAVAGWRLASLPKALSADEVKQLLACCDRRTHVGRRGYAVVLAMVRLGLRAGEVAALTLDDVDWTRGEIVICGKGRQLDRLPLPADVGAALAAYVRWSRPASSSRRLVLRVRAPHGPLSSNGVKAIVNLAYARAGLVARGAHRLRHTAATEMLRQGASLSDIAQVLRHRHVDTTAIYAKVDRVALQALVQPWPRGDV